MDENQPEYSATIVTRDPSVNLTVAQIAERLRQEHETFNQHKLQEHQWFRLRQLMGYSAVFLLFVLVSIPAYIIYSYASFSANVVAAAVAALFVDILSLILSVWKVVLNPTFMTKLSPITQIQQSGIGVTNQLPASDSQTILIFFAQYGINESWIDVAPILRAKIAEGRLQVTVTNEEFGGAEIDPARGVTKQLQITYAYKGATYSKTVPEKHTLIIPEP